MTDLPVNLRHTEGTDNRKLDLVVVIPVARCEWHLAVKLLHWIDSLNPSPTLIICCAPKMADEEMKALAAITPCEIFRADFVDTGYFGGANNMIRAALEYCEAKHPGKAMLWLEADAVPIGNNWFYNILDEYRGAGQPFGGDIHLCALDHMTGVACYHPNWRTIAPGFAQLPGPDPEWGWDSMLASETITRCHRMRTIQQIWRPPLPITAEWAAKNIRTETALFHQCKDGSLIDVLCKQHGLPLIPLPNQLEGSTYSKGRQTPEDPALVARLSPQQRVIAGMRSEAAPVGMGILIVTCAKHMDYLRYCLKSLEKNARGFTEIVVAVQDDEVHQFNWVKKQRLHIYTPADRAKPMLSHEVIKCRADEILPASEAILFLDSDCMMWRPATPESFVIGGKLRIIRERYADARNKLRRSWQKAAEASLGFKPEYDGMVAHGITYYRDLFPALRKATEAHTGMQFDEHVVAGHDSFPQQYAEFGSMVAIAIRDFRHRYHCVDYDWRKDCREMGIPEADEFQYAYRSDRDVVVEFWGHAPISRYKSDAEAFLRGQIPRYYLK